MKFEQVVKAIEEEFAVILHKGQTIIPKGVWHYDILPDGDYEVASGPNKGCRFSTYDAAHRAAHQGWIPRLRALLPNGSDVVFNTAYSSASVEINLPTYGCKGISLLDLPFGGPQTLPKGWGCVSRTSAHTED